MKLEPRVFANPWEVTFDHIRSAMNGASGSYYAEQTRRERAPRSAGSSTVFEGTLERLIYRPADTRSKTPARFRLQFAGIEGRTLSGSEFARRAKEFAGRSGFTFKYKGFHVTDSTLAAKEYDLVFLAHGKRSLQQGTVDVYRMVAIPKRWDRTAWLLELDTSTGYPLYAGAYALTETQGIVLQSEIIVTSFLTGVRVPDANDPSWWSPINGIEATASAEAAVKKALSQSTKYVLPVLADLPGGFRLERSEVHTDPYKGDRRAVLSFSDGIDQVFVTEQNIPLRARGAEDTIWYLDERGMTQCGFSHHGVQFYVVGRSTRETVRRASIGMFRRAVEILK